MTKLEVLPASKIHKFMYHFHRHVGVTLLCKVPLGVPAKSKSLLLMCPETALEALVARAHWHSDGPHVNIMAIPPWEVPIWEDCISYMTAIDP
jgi:hypothetical protein